ncbi:hypothetical protein PIROE2DRAFT_1791 [Piromyces sp. E2]|nr:hypothetical protein PIROE2DRAFT_1791 [Piromyces sp. E2]|eukprot:OUM70111.1 hypothetical protein PIROE2DRAFT_1791 [Piromyces sp. E2]
MNVVYDKRDYILPFKKYLNKPKKSVSFVQKVDFEYTYGKNDYDRKPIENVEQVTLRELYELTLSRIEARKSNVYYSNQAPKEDIPDFVNLKYDDISEESKISIINKIEQVKMSNMEVDELEGKSKGIKKIKLDFDKANTVTESTEFQRNEKESPVINDEASVQHSNSSKSSDSNPEKENPNEVEQNNNTKIIVPFIDNDDTEINTQEQPQQPLTEGPVTSLPEINEASPKESPMNLPPNQVDPNRPPLGRNVFLPNGEINYENLPNTFVSPKRLDSKNRRGSGSGINSPLDLAHYKPPLKSLEEINDPNYEKNIGHEPIPYGSNVVYEEPEITSPNLEHAIPIYNRPKINYRNNLINMTYNSNNSYPGVNNQSDTTSNTSSPKMIEGQPQEVEKKKEKKNNRKSLSFLHILRKSKSADNIKSSKSRMSLFKPASKTNSIPVNTPQENKRSTSPPLSHHTLPLNDLVESNKPVTKNIHNRVSIVNNFTEPTINDLVSDGPALFNNENKTLSKYALKTLKLRQSDSQLHVNINNLQIPGSPSNGRKSPLSARSNHSSNSSHSNPSVQKQTHTYVPNIPLD